MPKAENNFMKKNMYTAEDEYQKQKRKRNRKQRTKIVENAKDNHDYEKILNANDASYMDIPERTAIFSTESTGAYNTSVKIHLNQNYLPTTLDKPTQLNQKQQSTPV